MVPVITEIPASRSGHLGHPESDILGVNVRWQHCAHWKSVFPPRSERFCFGCFQAGTQTKMLSKETVACISQSKADHHGPHVVCNYHF